MNVTTRIISQMNDQRDHIFIVTLDLSEFGPKPFQGAWGVVYIMKSRGPNTKPWGTPH